MDKKVRSDRAPFKLTKTRRKRLVGSVVTGIAFALALLSTAWACTLHSGGVFAPLAGPPGTKVAVAASTYSTTFNGTRGIYIEGPAPHSIGPTEHLTAPDVCSVSTSEVIGDITYRNGVGVGTATIPVAVDGRNVEHGEQYEMCAAPNNTGGPGASFPAWDVFTIVKV